MEVGRRAVLPSDRDFCKGLHDELRPLAEALGFEWDEAAMDAGFDRKWDRENSAILVVDDEDVGWVQLEWHPGRLNLREVFVVGAWRNRGVGTTVIRQLVANAHDLGLDVTLAVLVNNPALALYRRLGFVVEREDGVKAWLRLVQ